MKVMFWQRQQQLQHSILSYVLCQLISKPADQKDVAGERDVTYNSLTHICIISPVLHKTNVCNITSNERIEDFK